MRRTNNQVLEICREDGSVVFAMEEREKEGVFFIRLSGEIKNDVAYEFEDELMAALLIGRKVELDLTEVSYIASAGMQAILSARQMLEDITCSELCVTGVSEAVEKVFQETGLSELFTKKSRWGEDSKDHETV